ncbi:beta-ribofuranosylaminobenzene 5'-phosphate synthase [Methylomagnum ishizawai]|nr:beta-ribofuranosylaminobenzene 5'-phosphate synthase [Methylomagnum ishizawai]
MTMDFPTAPNRRVRVMAPARLHMGFLDIGGSLGRRFGSIGVGVNEIATRLSLEPAPQPTATGPGAERAVAAAQKFARAVGRPCPAAIRIEQAIPGHAGLGSGTQLALAVGMGLSQLYGLGLGVRDIAPLIERGARSGIGIAVFEQGGLVVDGGRGEHTSIPPVLARMEIPADWRFVLILDDRAQGLHGAAEIEAFRALPPFPAEEAARLCHWLLMKGLPALAERDIAGFGAVVAELQRAVGDYFAPAQGGRFTSPEVSAALEFLAARGAVGIGQSSWGPTGFCLVEGGATAEALLAEVQARFAHRGELQFLLGTARGRGAEISVEPLDSTAR